MTLKLASPPRPPAQGRLSCDFHFLLLLLFREQDGDLRVPVHHVEDDKKLGAWIRMNRAQKGRDTLYPEEERRSNEIGFIWNAYEGKVDIMITALIQC